MPYTENFDAATAPATPTCIAIEDVNGSNTWTTYASTFTGSTSPNVMRYSANYSTPADDWFFLRGLTLTAGTPYNISFRYLGTTYNTEKLEVRAGTAPNAAAALAGTQVFNNANIATLENGNGIFTPATTGIYYFGFHAYSAANQYELYVDNVNVRIVCTAPSIPVVDSVTATTVSVSFSSLGDNFIIDYGPAGFTPGTFTSPGTGGSVATGTSSPIVLTGLSNGKTYDVYVRRNCSSIGSGYGPNSAKATFTTLCTTGTIPYTENFDAVTAPALPPCMTIENTNGSNTWAVAASVPSSFFSSPNTMKYIYSSTTAADDWFYIKALPLTAGSTYRLAFKFSGTTLEVRAATGPTSVAALAGTQIFDYSSNTPFLGGGAASFTPISSGIYYFAFHVYSPANQNTVYVDNINVTLTTPCASVNGYTDSITTTSASVQFQPAGSNVIVEYGTTGIVPGTGASAGTGSTVINAISSPVMLTGLLPSTWYYVYIRRNCSAAGNSYSDNRLIDSSKTATPPPLNDLPAGAFTLTVGAGCTGAAFSNAGATK